MHCWFLALLAAQSSFLHRGHAGANEPLILSRQLPSVTVFQEDMLKLNMTIGADCQTDCRLRIVIGLSCYLPTGPEDDRVPLMINGTSVLADSCSYTWTSATHYGVNLMVNDLPPPIELSQWSKNASRDGESDCPRYTFTVLSDQFYKAPPELYVHSPFEGVMQSMTHIGSGAVHTFVADALYHVVLFRTIQPTRDTGGYIEGYTGGIGPEGDKTRLVDTFEMDGRSLISPVKWSDRIATLWFINGTFDVAFKSLHELHNVASNVSSVTGSGVYDTLYADELSYGYPADDIVDGSFEWTYNNTGTPLFYFRLNVADLYGGTLKYKMYYENVVNVMDNVELLFTETTTEVYCSSRINRIETYWGAAVTNARMRTRLEWHRQDNPTRKCTEIVPVPTASTVISSKTTRGPQTEPKPGANLARFGVIIGCTMGGVLLIVALVLFVLWRRKRILEFEEMIAKQIGEVGARSHLAQYLKIQARANMKADVEWEIDPIALFFGEELCQNGRHTHKKTILYGAPPCTFVYPALKVLYPVTPNGMEVVVKSATQERPKIEILDEIKVLKTIPPYAHLLSMIGCVTNPSNPMVVTEYCALGDLLTLVRKIRRKQKEDEIKLKFADFPLISWQVADGLAFLTSIKVIHRDVAARNVLLTLEKLVKICDFAQSRPGENYYYVHNTRQNRTPIRWSAPEAACHGKFSEKSDVWSFGVLLWEMHTFGQTPFEDISIEELPDYLNNGGTLVPPGDTPHWMAEIMRSCWEFKPKLRPGIGKLAARLRRHFQLMKHSEYYVNLSDAHEMSIEVQDRSPVTEEVEETLRL